MENLGLLIYQEPLSCSYFPKSHINTFCFLFVFVYIIFVIYFYINLFLLWLIKPLCIKYIRADKNLNKVIRSPNFNDGGSVLICKTNTNKLPLRLKSTMITSLPNYWLQLVI